MTRPYVVPTLKDGNVRVLPDRDADRSPMDLAPGEARALAVHLLSVAGGRVYVDVDPGPRPGPTDDGRPIPLRGFQSVVRYEPGTDTVRVELLNSARDSLLDKVADWVLAGVRAALRIK